MYKPSPQCWPCCGLSLEVGGNKIFSLRGGRLVNNILTRTYASVTPGVAKSPPQNCKYFYINFLGRFFYSGRTPSGNRISTATHRAAVYSSARLQHSDSVLCTVSAVNPSTVSISSIHHISLSKNFSHRVFKYSTQFFLQQIFLHTSTPRVLRSRLTLCYCML